MYVQFPACVCAFSPLSGSLYYYESMMGGSVHSGGRPVVFWGSLLWASCKQFLVG